MTADVAAELGAFPTKCIFITRLSAGLGLCATTAAVNLNPVSQVIGFSEDLHPKVATDAAAELEALKTFPQWCKELAEDNGQQYETLSSNIASTKAAIEDDTAKIASISADIASLASEMQVIGLLEDVHANMTADAAAELEASKTYSQWGKEQETMQHHEQRPRGTVRTIVQTRQLRSGQTGKRSSSGTLTSSSTRSPSFS